MANPDELTDLKDLNKDTPAGQNTPTAEHEAELRHRRIQREAMQDAKRAEERENRDEVGNDEFKNIGPV